MSRIAPSAIGSHGKTVLAVIVMFLVPTLAKAASSIDQQTLELSFFAAMDRLNLSTKPPAPAGELPAINDGQVYNGKDILERATLEKAPAASNSLFTNTQLMMAISNGDGSIALREELSFCRELDIFSAEGETFPEKATCDSNAYSVGVTSKGVVVNVNNEPFRHYDLERGTYLLNGVPFLVDGL